MAVTHDDYMRGLEAYRGDGSIRSVQKALVITWKQALDLVETGIPNKGLEPFEEVVSKELAMVKQAPTEGSLINAKDDLQANIILYKTIQKSALDYYSPDSTKGEKITIGDLKQLVELGQDLAKKDAAGKGEGMLLPYEDLTDQEFNDFALGKKKPRR